MTRLTFPENFLWGAAASSYQIEGGWDADGQGDNAVKVFKFQPHLFEAGESGTGYAMFGGEL